MLEDNFQADFTYLIKSISKRSSRKIFKADFLTTPLGDMLAICDEEVLHLLEFVDYKNLRREVEKLCEKQKANMVLGENIVTNSIKEELQAYFAGKLQKFTIPIEILGTDFQKTVWRGLQKIEYGKTCSYAYLASSINRKASIRAAANANGANQLAVIIPCHRVIAANGNLAGYAGGVERKKWLLQHEKKFFRGWEGSAPSSKA